jgi:hypothetical protein
MYVSKNVVAATLGISSIKNRYLFDTTQEQAEQKLSDLKNKIKERITEALNRPATENYYLKKGQQIYNITWLKTICIPHIENVSKLSDKKPTLRNSRKLSLLSPQQKNAIIEQYMRGVERDLKNTPIT